MNPLMDKEKKIIEEVAKAEGLSVVVDNTLVVCGITDITEKVSKLFQGGEKTDPNSTPTVSANKETPKQVVGYLSQQRVYDIPKMKDVQDTYYNEYMIMQGKIEKETKDLKDKEKVAKIITDYQKKLDEKKKELFKPVEDAINAAADGIAKEKGLIVILNDTDILYGGVDITSDVIDKVK
jgi:outer membrane protein